MEDSKGAVGAGQFPVQQPCYRRPGTVLLAVSDQFRSLPLYLAQRETRFFFIPLGSLHALENNTTLLRRNIYAHSFLSFFFF